MCGICGIVTAEPARRPAEVLKRMVLRLRHRGPDEYGLFEDEGAGLAQARLSIIDLSTGTQPMHNEDESLWIIYNGEIFNYLELREELLACGHRFYTKCDTEVVLHAYEQYGPGCLSRFNGQFAIAIWDRNRQELFLARDRVGIRPLYLHVSPGLLAFASEIKSLLLVPGLTARLDPRGLEQTLTLWSTQAPRTPFEGIEELEPGHWLRYRSREGSLSRKAYWNLRFASEEELDRRPLAVCREELRSLLLDASRIRLRADVPVGAYLSGGLDSSVITTIVKRFTDTPLKTFSVSFEDKVFDESVHQRRVVSHLGTDHQEVFCTNRAIAELFPKVVWFAEKPLLRTAPTPLMLLSGLVRENHFKVVLTGEGADEFLGGYNIFKEAKIRAFWAKDPSSRLRPLLFRRLYPYLETPGQGKRSFLQLFFRQGLEETGQPTYSHQVRWRNTARIGSYLADGVLEAADGYDPVEELTSRLPDGFGSWPLLHKAQFLEIQTFLSSYLLSSQGDRMAMANSVEGRFPFLDYRVMELCAKLPPSYKLRVLDEKHLLKQAFAQELPPEVIRRPKQPYRAPISRSFFAPGAPDYVESLLAGEGIRRNGCFRPEAVEKLFLKCRNPEAFVSEVENMAVAFILSLQLLQEQFLGPGSSEEPDPDSVPFTHFKKGKGEGCL
ncbi:MAG: asparagine synthase (glutamine-hydrolyzing) [bacterium]